MELWVAEADGEIVSSGRLEPVPGTEFAGIWGGATRPEWRGRGLYRALTAARARSALVLGKRLIHSDSTEASRPILERAGLVKVRRRRPICGSPAGSPVGRRASCVAWASVLSPDICSEGLPRCLARINRAEQSRYVGTRSPRPLSPRWLQSPRRSQSSRRTSYTVIGSPERPRPGPRAANPRLAARRRDGSFAPSSM